MAAKPLKNLIQHEAYRLVFFQLTGVIVLAAIAFLFSGSSHGFAVFAGGMAYGLPNLIFVWAVFRQVGAHQMMRFISAFFIGEMIKLLISAILFVLIAKYLRVNLLSELIGFIGAIVCFWIACLWYFSRKPNATQTIRH